MLQFYTGVPPAAQRRDAAHCKEALLPTAVANSPPVAWACHLAAPKRSTTRPGRWVDSSRRMRFATCAFPPKRDKDAMMMAAIRPPCTPEPHPVALPFGQTCEGIDQTHHHKPAHKSVILLCFMATSDEYQPWINLPRPMSGNALNHQAAQSLLLGLTCESTQQQTHSSDRVPTRFRLTSAGVGVSSGTL